MNDAKVEAWSPKYQAGGILYVVTKLPPEGRVPYTVPDFGDLPDLIGAGLGGIAFLGGLGWVIKVGGQWGRPCTDSC